MTEEEKSLATVKSAITTQDFANDLNSMMALVKEQMREGQDFGIIPGTKKKALFDPGAEKLAKFFGLVPSYELVKEVENFEKGFFYYTYRCTLTHFKTGRVAGSAERSCNSFEKKYLYGFKGRNTPEQLTEKINTYQAMAQKRAFVESVKTATMASEIFADTAVRDEAPNKPVTKEENPQRIRLMARFYAAASERGFPQKTAHDIVIQKYKVDSMTNVTDRQLEETTESLVLKYDVVPKGEKPRALNAEAPVAPSVASQKTEAAPIEEGEVVGDEEQEEELDDIDRGLELTPESKKKLKASKTTQISESADPTAHDGESATASAKTCHCGCKTVINGEPYNEYFLNREHHEKWSAENYPKRHAKGKLEELLEKGRAARAAEEKGAATA